MQSQSPDLKECAIFRTIVSVVLEQSPQSVGWLLVHIPRCLLDDPRAVVVLRNDTVENLADRCVPHRPRTNSELRVPAWVIANDSRVRMLNEVEHPEQLLACSL